VDRDRIGRIGRRVGFVHAGQPRLWVGLDDLGPSHVAGRVHVDLKGSSPVVMADDLDQGAILQGRDPLHGRPVGLAERRAGFTKPEGDIPRLPTGAPPEPYEAQLRRGA
jgi:hypothetical protein